MSKVSDDKYIEYLQSELNRANQLLERIVVANRKDHWEIGESFESVMSDAGEYVAFLKLAAKIESEEPMS